MRLKVLVHGDILDSVPSKAAVSQLDNPAWSKVGHEARSAASLMTEPAADLMSKP